MSKSYLNLRCLILKYSVRQPELANYLSIGVSTLSAKINGRSIWTQEEMYMICDFFNELDPEEKPAPYENLHLLFPIEDYRGYKKK